MFLLATARNLTILVVVTVLIAYMGMFQSMELKYWDTRETNLYHTPSNGGLVRSYGPHIYMRALTFLSWIKYDLGHQPTINLLHKLMVDI